MTITCYVSSAISLTCSLRCTRSAYCIQHTLDKHSFERKIANVFLLNPVKAFHNVQPMHSALPMSEEAKQNAWAEHYERLLNVEFDWDPDHLSNEPPLEGPPIPITIDMVKK